MLIYLVKCSVALLALWFVQYLHIIPWPGLASLVASVIVPIGLAALAWRSSKRTTLRNLASGLGIDLNTRQSENATQDHHRTSL